VFPDKDKMLEHVRNALAKPAYDVSELYWTAGHFQRLARAQSFEIFTLGVICINALWLAIDTDMNTATDLADTPFYFKVVDNAFCFFFVFEWGVRFGAFRRKWQSFTDAWFLFDTLLALLMIFETWVLVLVIWMMGPSSSAIDVGFLRLLRLMRLARTGRVAKVLRAMPEMLIMIKGIYAATRSVFFTLILLILLVYVYSITFRQLTVGLDWEYADFYFPTVPKSMMSLLWDGVLPDNAPMMYHLCKDHWGLGLLHGSFILVSSLTVLNMLVGVLCEVVSTVATVEREELAAEHVKSHLLSVLLSNDEDGNQLVSRHEFQEVLLQQQTRNLLVGCGVDIIGLLELTEYIFRESEEITFGEFFSLVLQLRGSNTCTVKDIVDTRKFFHTELLLVSEKIRLWLEDLGTHATKTSIMAAERSSNRRPGTSVISDDDSHLT
jgi:hypothetical protein